VHNPLTPFLDSAGYLILDGAMATELEARGADLNNALWSARLLLENPALIAAVHRDYLLAGADVLITASYQASFAGFAQRGLDAEAAARLMRLSVELACRVRDEFWADPAHRAGRLKPLVAASVGPYGAVLHDGSEYRGDYGLSVAELMAFHRPRLAVLASAGADLLACETIPSLAEAEALVRLLPEFPEMPAWISASARDGLHLCHGEALTALLALTDDCPQVVAAGINCTSPEFIESLLASGAASAKPLLTYPNRGEQWDGVQHCWVGGTGIVDYGAEALRWRRAGAKLVGGCCRSTPADIRAIRRALQ
jgi:homocysteine S-methyltransferase